MATGTQASVTGAQVKDEHIVQHWGVEDGLSQNTVSAILEDHQGYIWLGTWNGLNRFNGYEFELFYPTERGISSRVEALYEDEQEQLWWTTYKNEALYRMNPLRTSITRCPLSEMPQAMAEQIAHRADSMFIDRQDVVWVIDHQPGIRRMRDGRWKRLTPPVDSRFEGMLDANSVMLYDHQGRLWVNPTGGGFGYYDYDKDEIVCPLRTTSTIHTAYFDREGRLWLSTYDKGVECIDWSEQPYQVHDLSVWGKVMGEVRAMYRDPKTDEVEIVARDKRQVYSIAETSRGRLYGTRHNGIRLANGKPSGYVTNNNKVYDMLASGDTLIVATQGGGVNIFYPDGKHVIRANGAKVRCIERIGDDLYAGSQKGVLRITPDGKVQTIGQADIRCLTSVEGTIWGGSYGGGLFRIDGDSLQRMDAGEDRVIAIAALGHKLYLASESGITQYDTRTGDHTYFSPLEKSRKAYFSETKALVRADSVILFGYCQGYVEFEPNKVKPLGQTVPLKIQFIFSHDVHNVHDGQTLVLEHNQGSFAVKYAALEYTDPDHIDYECMLEGYDKGWRAMGNERVVQYTSLEPGHYTFRVRSTNRAGEWVNNEQQLEIEVKQSIWMSWWMWGVYAIVLALILLTSIWVSRRNERLRQEVKKGEELTAAKLHFYTNISHELRTPLTLITAPVESMLRHEHLSAAARQQLEIVRNNGQRMMRMVNQILDFRKIQNKKMRLKVQLTHLAEVAQTTTENFTKEANDRQIELQISNRAKDDTLWIDREAIDTVIYNLLSNAFKYSEDRTHISVLVDERTEFVLLSVSDEGIGISKDRQQKLFERFNSHSDRNAPTNRPGTGIGLNLVKDLVDLHHGFVEIESTQGKGTTFTVVLRRGKDHFRNDVDYILDDTTATVEPKQEEQIAPSSQRKSLVVVVDDNPDMRTFLTAILSTKYEVLSAGDGIEALPIIRREQPTLVLTDLMMPNMDGLQLTERIKTDEELMHIPVILLSAKSAIESRLEAMGIGADDYLTKPFEPEYIQARVDNLIAQRKMLERTYRERLLKMEPQEVNATPSADDDFLYRLHAVMEKHMDNNSLTVDELVEEMNMGRTVFFNRLKGLTGLSPVEFIRDIRIKRAAKLLMEPELNISEVAYMVGMNDSRYFSRCFKNAFGLTPSEYKLKHKL